MGKSTPPAPDYRAAAEATAAANKEAMVYQTWGNRIDQNNPWGSISYESTPYTDPATGEEVTRWTQNTTLDPQLQQALDAQIALQNMRSQQAQDMYGRAEAAVSDPFNPYLTAWGQAPGAMQLGGFFGDPSTMRTGNWDPAVMNEMTGNMDVNRTIGGNMNVNQGYLSNEEINALRQKSEDAMYDRQTSRLDPQFQQERERKESQLTAMGLRPTDQAWIDQMDQFNRGRNDAYEQARLGSIGEGRNEYQTMFGTGLQAQQFSNQAMQQNLANRFNQLGVNNQALQQNLGNRFNQLGVNNQAAQQNLSNYWQDLQQDNAARQQNFANEMKQQGFNNDQIAQMWESEMRNSAYQNQLRQAQLTEQMAMRSQPLNEITAWLNGQQVQNPQFNSFAQQGYVGGPDYMGAANSQYSADLDAFNASQMGLNSFLGGLGGIFGTAGNFGMFG